MTDITNWIDEEIKTTSRPTSFEKLPSLKMQPNKLVELEIDFTNPFNKWTSPKGVIKAIVPVKVKGESFNWWINIKNPIYSEILAKAKQGMKTFKISQIGTGEDTRYNLLE